MVLDDFIYLQSIEDVENENLDIVESANFQPLGKCKILPNTSASKTNTEDGKEFIYAYQVVMKIPKCGAYPKEGDVVRIVKKDGSIDKRMQVKGFVTLKKWVKIWL